MENDDTSYLVRYQSNPVGEPEQDLESEIIGYWNEGCHDIASSAVKICGLSWSEERGLAEFLETGSKALSLRMQLGAQCNKAMT